MQDTTRDTKPEDQPAARTEAQDVRLRPVLVFTVGLIVALIAVYLVVVAMFRIFSRDEARQNATAGAGQTVSAGQGGEPLPPGPRIQADPAADMARLRHREDAVLDSYGWVDRQAGVVRVPIDVAMKLVLAEGLPTREPSSAPPAAGTPASSASATKGERKSP